MGPVLTATRFSSTGCIPTEPMSGAWRFCRGLAMNGIDLKSFHDFWGKGVSCATFLKVGTLCFCRKVVLIFFEEY